MHKRKFIMIGAAFVNLFLALILIHSAWRYYKVWDKSGPGQSQYVNLQSAELDKIRVKYDEKLLHMVNYGLFPLNALVMGTSAFLFWRYRKNFEDSR